MAMLDDVRLASEIDGNIPDKFWPDETDAMLYAGELNFTAGPSGVGKSMLSLLRASQLTNEGRNVIYINHEDSELMQKFRFEVAGADLARVFITQLQIPSGLQRLRLLIEEHDVALVVFDTALKTIEGPMQRWDLPLKRLVREVLQPTGCTGDMIHHTNKNVKSKAGWHAAIGGSTGGLVGTGRSGQLVGRRLDDPSQTVLAPVKDSYDAPGDCIAYEFKTKTVKQANGDEAEVSYLSEVERGIKYTEEERTQLVVVNGSGSGGKKGPAPTELAAANEFLIEILKFGPVPVDTQWRCLDNPNSTEDGEAPEHNVSNPHKPGSAEFDKYDPKGKDNTDWRSRECGVKAAGIVDGKDPRCPDCGGRLEEVQGISEYYERMSPECSWSTIKRSKGPLELNVMKRGAGKAGFWIWAMPSDHPDLDSGAKDYLP